MLAEYWKSGALLTGLGSLVVWWVKRTYFPSEKSGRAEARESRPTRVLRAREPAVYGMRR